MIHCLKLFFLLLSILFQLELLHREEPEFFLSFFIFTPAQGRNRYLLEIRRCQIHVAPHLCVNILKSAEILRCPALNYCCYSFFFLLLRLKHHQGTRSCSSHFIVECFFVFGCLFFFKYCWLDRGNLLIYVLQMHNLFQATL